MPAGEGISSGLAGPKVFDDPFQHSQCHNPRHVTRIPAQDAAVRSDSDEAALGCPFDRGIRFTKMPRAGSDGQRVEAKTKAEAFTHSGTLEADVTVRRIEHGLNAGFSNKPSEIATAPTEQGPQKKTLGFPGQSGACAHSRKTPKTSTAGQPHQKRLGLINSVMGRHDSAQPVSESPLAQRSIAGLPRALLQGRPRRE
jgi:hypothetical protein